MRASRLSRDQLLDRLGRVFRQDGYAGASLAGLAAAATLGKASLYQKFPDGKAGMGAAVLAAADEWLQTRAITPLSGDGPPAALFRTALDALDEYYAGGTLPCLVDALSFGEGAELYRPALQKGVAAWRDALATLARRAGLPRPKALAWAETVLVSVQGALVVSRALGDPAVFRRTLRRLADEAPLGKEVGS